jgi:serine/threonine-protein kinase
MIGKLLDHRYQVIRVLATGGFGQTYIAQDTRRPGNPICVVKHLKPANSDPNIFVTAKRLFNSEAETLEKLSNNDQIPRLLAYFDENQEFFLVQEFIDGHTLSEELIPGQPWSEVQVMQMLLEILSILEFVHQEGVIHRDIKPDNIIRREADYKLVLVDFGAVKQLRSPLVLVGGQQTATVAIGTPGYMPTEQGQGKPRPNSDIYALGIIAIQALTGVPVSQLQEDPDTGEINWQHLIPVNPELVAILTKMVRYHFKERYQTATEALQACRDLVNITPELSQPSLSPQIIYQSPPPLASRFIQKTMAVSPANHVPSQPAPQQQYIPQESNKPGS